MKQFSIQHFSQSATYAVTASVTILGLLFMGFFFAEPSITHGQVQSSEFTVSQTIVDETSFLVEPADVSTSGSINGVTGGNASGTTDFSVISNNATGYYVEIDFFDNGSTEAMQGETTLSSAIVDYLGSAAEPDYGYTATTSAQFAYTVSSVDPEDTDDSFLNFGGACGTGNVSATQNGTATSTKCWMAPATTPFRIVDSGNAATAGATSTIEFDITVPSGAVPVPTAEVYTATATLTLYIQ